MPWKTLCKHCTPPLPWKLWSIISSSSVIYIPAPLCCGKERGGEPFCFPFNCRSPDTLTCIISISQKKDFLSLLFKNEISRESKRSFRPFHSKQCLHSKRRRWKARAALFQVPENGAAASEREQYSPYRYHSVKPLMEFSKPSEGIWRRRLLWSSALGWWQRLALPRKVCPCPCSMGGRWVRVAMRTFVFLKGMVTT